MAQRCLTECVWAKWRKLQQCSPDQMQHLLVFNSIKLLEVAPPHLYARWYACASSFLGPSRIMTRQASQIFSLRNAGKHSWIGCALSSLVTISVQKAPQSKKYSGQLQVLLIKVLFVWRSRTISRLFTLTPTAQSSRLTLYHQSHFSDNSVSFWFFFVFLCPVSRQ